MENKNIFNVNGKLLYKSVAAKTLREAVEEAVANNIDLSEANLAGANLTRIDFSGVNLFEVDFTGANLAWANLVEANITGANLAKANLARANLNGANLGDANLNEANLSDANLSAIKEDFFQVLATAKDEVAGLLQALREGKIDGSCYASRPAERWFTGISSGDTPESNPVAKITEGWILEFQDSNLTRQ